MGDIDALGALCALLDRSVVQIAEASSDARLFDRGLVVQVADIWDNNTYKLFHAAVGTGPSQKSDRALAALKWMAEFHREWMVEQGAVAGFALDDVLPPNPPPAPFRDSRGEVHPRSEVLGAETVEELVADYDLDASQVTYFHAERAGRRLTANLRLTAARRFPIDGGPSGSGPVIGVSLNDVSALTAEAADLRGSALAITDHGVRVSLGSRGFLEAASGHLRVDDGDWHLSAAGRRADLVVPPRSENRDDFVSPKPATTLSRHAELAAEALYDTMIGIRAVRYSFLVDLQAITDSCQGYFGAGHQLVKASRRRLPIRRNAILRRLAAAGTLPFGPRPPVLDAAHPGSAEAELRMASYTAPHERYGRQKEEGLLRHYAVPSETRPGTEPWRISILEDPEPSAFRIRFEDFQASEF